jgi:hypothetical protein
MKSPQAMVSFPGVGNASSRKDRAVEDLPRDIADAPTGRRATCSRRSRNEFFGVVAAMDPQQDDNAPAGFYGAVYLVISDGRLTRNRYFSIPRETLRPPDRQRLVGFDNSPPYRLILVDHLKLAGHQHAGALQIRRL